MNLMQKMNDFVQSRGQMMLAGAFGYEGRSLGRKLIHGLQRNIDSGIIKEVERLLGEKERIKILEVGAGLSYPVRDFGGCDGAPWLSRGLAYILGERCQVIASDVRETNHQIVYLSENGEVVVDSFCHDPEIAKDIEIPVSEIVTAGGKVKVLPIARERYLREQQRVIDFIGNQFKETYQRQKEVIGEQSQIYIRPEIDPELERALFGLDFRSGVSYYRLEQHFPEERFDFIIGRYLHDSIDVDRRTTEQIVTESASRIIVPRGKIITEHV